MPVRAGSPTWLGEEAEWPAVRQADAWSQYCTEHPPDGGGPSGRELAQQGHMAACVEASMATMRAGCEPAGGEIAGRRCQAAPALGSCALLCARRPSRPERNAEHR